MQKVAELLHDAREAKKLTVHQVAESTKIRTDHIRALEEGNYNIFPAPVYIRGFVRAYATTLKLDVPMVMAALDAELGQSEKFSEPPPLSKQPRGVLDFVTLQLSKLNWRLGLGILIAVVVVLVIVMIVSIVKSRKKSDPLSGLPPAVYQPARTNTSDTLPLPPATKRR